MSSNLWVNLIGFQIYWWLCVLGQEESVFIALGMLLLHLSFHSKAGVEVTVILLCGLLGYAVDSLLTVQGVFVFPYEPTAGAPLWLLMLWFGFAAMLTNSMAFLQSRILMAAALGAVVAPLSYMAGAALGAVTLPLSLSLTWLLLAAVWLVLLPLLLSLAHILVLRL